jgi:tetratricopeptide (TPR) repeat protein
VIEQILVADRHLQVDQVAKARDIFERVVALDPGNAIAVVGLARCALADGEDGLAYELAARALSIDPENDMARRMEARLSEVLATCGVPVERPAAAALPGGPEMRPVVTQPASSDSVPLRAPATAPMSPAAPRPPMTPTPTPTPTPTDPAATSIATPRKEPPVRKSLIDRLLGR